jgi:hypothetical protein
MSGSIGQMINQAQSMPQPGGFSIPTNIYSGPAQMPVPQGSAMTPLQMIQAYRSGSSWDQLNAMNPRGAMPVAPTPLPMSLFSAPPAPAPAPATAPYSPPDTGTPYQGGW